VLDERYSSDGLVASLERHLGDAHMTDATLPLLLTAYDTSARAIRFLRSEGSGSDLSMVVAAHATSAAPTYFEPVAVGDETLVDGGVFAVNPAMCAYADVAPAGPIDLIASLGTGSKTEDHPIRGAEGWGQLEWARPIIDVVFDGVADTVDYQVSTLLPAGAYVRLQTRLRDASGALDDASAANLRALQGEARRLIAERSHDIDALCEKVAA